MRKNRINISPERRKRIAIKRKKQLELQKEIKQMEETSKKHEDEYKIFKERLTKWKRCRHARYSNNAHHGLNSKLLMLKDDIKSLETAWCTSAVSKSNRGTCPFAPQSDAPCFSEITK